MLFVAGCHDAEVLRPSESVTDKTIHNKLPVTGYINPLPVFNYYDMRKRRNKNTRYISVLSLPWFRMHRNVPCIFIPAGDSRHDELNTKRLYKFQERLPSLLRTLINTSILQHMHKDFSDLFFQNLHHICFRDFFIF